MGGKFLLGGNKLAGKSCLAGRNRWDIFGGIFILAGTGYFSRRYNFFGGKMDGT